VIAGVQRFSREDWITDRAVCVCVVDLLECLGQCEAESLWESHRLITLTVGDRNKPWVREVCGLFCVKSFSVWHSHYCVTHTHTHTHTLAVQLHTFKSISFCDLTSLVFPVDDVHLSSGSHLVCSENKARLVCVCVCRPPDAPGPTQR